MNTVVSDYRGRTAEGEDIRALMAAADEDARENWGDPAWMRQFLTDITETIYEGFSHENLIQFFAEVENADEGERITVEEVRGLEIFWVAMGGQVDASRLTDRVWDMRPDYPAFHVYELERKMRNGFSRNSSRIQGLAIQALDAAINMRLFRTWQAAIPFGSDYYVGTAGFSLPSLRTALTEVEDEASDDPMGGNGVVIVGRPTAVNPLMDAIQDDNTFAPETQQRIIDLGVLGRYRGATVVTLRNYKDANERPYFPANELWVLARNAAKVGFWGGLRTQEWTQPGTARSNYFHLEGDREVGFVVHKPQRGRRLVNTAL